MSSNKSALAKQLAHFDIVDRDVQVGRGDAHVGVTRGVADLGQGSTAGQGMADERVPAVMNGDGLPPGDAQHPASRLEPPPQRVPRVPGLPATGPR